MLKYFSYLLSATLGIYLLIFLLSIYIFLNPKQTFLHIYNFIQITVFFFHTVLLIIRTIFLGHAPMASLFDSLLFYSWSISLVSFTMYLRYHEQTLSLLSVPVIFITLLKSYFSPQLIQPLSPALQTLWFETHVSTSFISYGLFTLGFSAGVLYLIKLKNKALICNFISPLPVVEKLVYRLCAWGFFLFTIAMTSGGIWAYLAWSNYFIWTPKELFSVILWLYYSTYLHARYTSGWQGRKTAYLAIGGFILVIFTYLGISLLMRSSHSF
ncbi:MAG: cytochrome c biogenesis protein CcsA [Candidatus Firestonebacteria bacterium]|nr:cytochrome c biogenesis protein CcsA [Candidatus Firestonebacteria bacterium]